MIKKRINIYDCIPKVSNYEDMMHSHGKQMTLTLIIISTILLTSLAFANEPIIVSQVELSDSSPGGLAVDETTFWFVDMDTNMIINIDGTGQILSSFTSPGDSPKGLTYDGSHLWLSESADNKIYQLTKNGEIATSFDTPGNYPRGLAFDGTYMWHSDSDKNRIYKLDLTGNVVGSFGAPGSSPHGLAFDGENLWVVDRDSETIFKISTSGTVLRSFDAPSESPYGIAFDGKYLWCVIRYGDYLYQLDIDHDLSNVPFLLSTRWGQRDQFARFTPDNYRAGCWSTAFSQILYYYQLQPVGSVSYTTSTGYTLDENFDSYPFNWKFFVDTFTESTTEQSIDEVAKYVYFTSVVIQKDFNTGTYVLNNSERVAALETHYACDVTQYQLSTTSLEELKQIIQDEVDACRPVMLYLTHPEIGHATVIDGYTTSGGMEYVHINMGGEGRNDGWYDINAPIILDSHEINKIFTVNPLNIDTTSQEFCNVDDDVVHTKNFNDSNRLFDWAEVTFPDFFYPPNQETFELEGFIYRYYSFTNTYIGTFDRNLFLYGSLFNGYLLIGEIDEYLP